jgi:outer membrane protein TolC
MKNVFLVLICALAATGHLSAQSLSLKQCIEYARQNNSSIKTASIDAEISSRKVVEQIGSALPQIDVTSTLTDNLSVATSLLPGALLGRTEEFIPIKMGTQYNATSTLSLTQKVIDGSFWVGLSAAQISKKHSQLQLSQSEESTGYDVCIAYIRTLVIQKQLENLRVILSVSKQVLESTELKYRSGLARSVDVDKIRVSYNSTRSQVQQTEMTCTQALNVLKYAMGMSMNNAITLSDSLSNVDGQFDQPSSGETQDFKRRFDYQLLETNLDAQEAKRNSTITEYLPTLSFTANYSYNAMRQNFDIIEGGKEWFQNSAIGLTLKIPIFSGFQRLSRLGASQLEVQKAKEAIRLKEQTIEIERSNNQLQLQTALDNISIEMENLQLAQRVYEITQLEYAQGTSSTLALVQAESALRDAQNNYYNRLLSLYTAQLDKKKAEGTLLTYINNLK